jgi:hypothetical protein
MAIEGADLILAKATEAGVGLRLGGSGSKGRRGVGVEGYVFKDDGE